MNQPEVPGFHHLQLCAAIPQGNGTTVYSVAKWPYLHRTMFCTLRLTGVAAANPAASKLTTLRLEGAVLGTRTAGTTCLLPDTTVLAVLSVERWRSAIVEPDQVLMTPKADQGSSACTKFALSLALVCGI